VLFNLVSYYKYQMRMENCANEWNLILFDRYTPVNDKIGYGENRESDYLCILTIYNFLLRTMRRYANLLAVLALSTNLALHAQTNELVIQTKKLGAEIQPTMYGLFFEDINYAADGGLYAELVKNRSFEFPQHFMGWKTFGKVSGRICGSGSQRTSPAGGKRHESQQPWHEVEQLRHGGRIASRRPAPARLAASGV
jgi:hypothetical protein